MRDNQSPYSLKEYTFALALTIGGLLMHWLLMPVLGASTPFILLGIIASAWYGGLGPGMVATAISGLSVTVLPKFIPTAVTTTPTNDLTFIFNLLGIGVLVSVLSESLHRERRKAEEQARQLGESHEQFRLLVYSVRDYGIFMLDPEGHVISWNQGAEHINGYSADEIIDQHFSRFYPPEDIAAGKTEMELREAAAHGRFEDEGWRLRKDGSRFWANVIITAVHDDEGHLRGFAKVTRDMTERKQAEDHNLLLMQEKTARQEAERANRTKDQFLAIVSHELRTPLNAILGWACLLHRKDLDPEQIEIGLETIERNARVQSRLVEDLLDVSRILTGKLSIEFSTVKLDTLVESVVNSVQPTAAAKGHEIQVEIAEDEVTVAGDEMRLQQVIWNLLSNAIKFTPNNGQIFVRLARVGSQAELTIRDNGRGIKPELLPFVFEHFRQADSSSTRHHGGLGLGLAIVRYVAEAHGGYVRAESPGEEQGATFTLYLPLLQAKDAVPLLPLSEPELTTAGVNASGSAASVAT